MSPIGRNVISYADTTVGTIAFNIQPPATLPREDLKHFLDLAASGEDEQSREEFLHAVTTWLGSDFWPLYVHERCHIIQACLYPALFLRGVRELIFIAMVFKALRDDDREQVPIKGSLPHDAYFPLLQSVYPYRVIEEGTRLHLTDGGAKVITRYDITENHLLEEDASIFQFKVEVGGAGDGASYRAWLRRRGSYSSIFRLLVRWFGDDDKAYFSLPPLVRGAFITTWPVTTFISLVDWTIRNSGPAGRPNEEGSYFEDLLDVLRRVLPEGFSGNLFDSGSNDQHELFGLVDWKELAKTSSVHPLSSLAVSAIPPTAASLTFPDWFWEPYRVLAVAGHSSMYALPEYEPPAMRNSCSPWLTIRC